MFTTVVSLNTIENVKGFVKIMAKQIFDADLVSGRYVIDAKSIMGIFSLDISKPIELRVHTEDGTAFATFKEEIKNYIVE